MYNAGEQIRFVAIVSKPNADVNGVEEEVKQVLKAKIKFSLMIPMLSEVSIWERI
jgi:putative ABC transport system permease protein